MEKKEYIQEQVDVINNLVDKISVSHLEDIINEYNVLYPPKIRAYIPGELGGHYKTGYPWEFNERGKISFSYADDSINQSKPQRDDYGGPY